GVLGGEVLGEGAVREAVDTLPVLGVQGEVGGGGVEERGDAGIVDLRCRGAGQGGGDQRPDAVADGQAAAPGTGQGAQQRVVGGVTVGQPGDGGGEQVAVGAGDQLGQLGGAGEQVRPGDDLVHGEPGLQELLAAGGDQHRGGVDGAGWGSQPAGAGR